MANNFKTTFQDIHYGKIKPNLILKLLLICIEFFYGIIIKSKNLLYKKNILKEKKVNAYVVCVGNLTTGGTGKTPVVNFLADELSKDKKTCIISRGYGAKLKIKEPVIVKDFTSIKFKDGSLCGDEPYQLAKKTGSNIMIIIHPDRLKAVNKALSEGCENIIFDDGFSNRKVKKDKTIIVIDSKMRFGNSHLLPYGPLREPVDEIERADEIVIVNKGDENFQDAIKWAEKFNKPVKTAQMDVKRIYNIQTKAPVIFSKNKLNAIAFCAIGQPEQFFDFAKKYYNLYKAIPFCDHHHYIKKDINELIKIAKKNNINTFITTQKDETKLENLIKDINGYSFNVIELCVNLL